MTGKMLSRAYLSFAAVAFGIIALLGFGPGSVRSFADSPSTATFLRGLLLLPLPIVLLALSDRGLQWNTARLPVLMTALGVSIFYLPGAIVALLALGLVWMARHDPLLCAPLDAGQAVLPKNHMVLLIGTIAAGCGLRLISVYEPFERDLMVYAMMGRGWFEGLALYSGVWDHKPPALYVVYAGAIAVFGQTPWALYALNCLFFILTLLGVHRAALRFAGPGAAVFAVLIWLFAGSDLILQANQPNVEVFLNACLIWALVLLMPRPQGAQIAWGRVAVAGLLFFVASAFKQIAVFPAAFVALAVLFNNRATTGADVIGWILPGLARLGLLAAIGALGWAVIFAAFWLFGDFDAFLYGVFGYNREYAGSLLHSILDGFRYPQLSLYFFAFVVFGACHLRHCATPMHLLMVAAYTGTFLMFAMPGKYWPHYYQVLLPLMAISGGWVLSRLFPQGLNWRLGAVLFAPIWVIFAFMTSPDRMAYVKYDREGHGSEAVESKQIGLRFAAEKRDMSRVMHWGAEPGVLFWSGGASPYKYVYYYPLVNGSRRDEMSAEAVTQISCMPPELIVVNKKQTHHQVGPAWDHIAAHYRPDPQGPMYQNFEFWVPNGTPMRCASGGSS